MDVVTVDVVTVTAETVTAETVTAGINVLPPGRARLIWARLTGACLLGCVALMATACAGDHKVTISDPTARNPVVDSAPSDKFPLPPL